MPIKKIKINIQQHYEIEFKNKITHIHLEEGCNIMPST
jgi:hypothetical protein